MTSRRAVLAGGMGSLAALALQGRGVAQPSLDERLRRCRLREPGPATPVTVEPPRALRPDAARRLEGARLVALYDRATWSEGPVWWARERLLVWSDVVGRRVLAWREDGAVDVLIDAAPFINGNAVDPQGRLLHCEHGRRALSVSDGGDTPRILATQADGERLNSPNDLVVTPDGAIWFTDPTFGIDDPREGCPARSESGRTSVCRLAPGADEAARMADMAQPNGIGFSPDGGTLYVSQTTPNEAENGIYAFGWDGTRLSDKRLFARVERGLSDGFAVDRQGWLWSSSGAGIEVFDPSGERIARVPMPGLSSNCAFDTQERRLFVTGNGTLWMLSLQG